MSGQNTEKNYFEVRYGGVGFTMDRILREPIIAPYKFNITRSDYAHLKYSDIINETQNLYFQVKYIQKLFHKPGLFITLYRRLL